MRTLIRLLATVLLGAGGLLAVLASPAAASPPPPRDLGAPDLGGYCRAQGYADVVLLGGTAYDWQCRTPDDRHAGLALDAACRWTYHTDLAVDRIGDFHHPDSVDCWRVRDDVVAPDFDRYCHGIGADGAVLTGGTAYDWHCVAGGARSDIDVLAACRETTFGYATVDRFIDFYDARSWQCRV
ncbi:hypothetical protein GCM10010168_48200 [Actinoplanes ianthinogenes]|uniref:Secreted protein n=1 Tax=Actinoplanes ianthinogenes TaxID=122358 RepID=A0ABM7LNU9_9ACTN|nr:hypothetical protein [Actinoplanes ianthinogenes]BCJ40880.1 hypothetical protein Aiant_15370 [Actinoplanes ianthinogenes]GGR24529.1 hypothetical protein GCM10010168_48200 [Actinoplanes ianthinogenes]